MNLIFIIPLGHAGLALSIGLASCLNAGLLWRGLRKRAIHQPQPGWGLFIAKLAVALAVMAAVLWAISGSDQLWLSLDAGGRLLRLALVIGAAVLAYFSSLYLLGFRVRDFSRRAA